MTRENPEPGSRSAAYRAAIRLLEHRDRSVADMRGRLLARGFDEECVEDTVARLQRERFLDDDRFAERFTESVRASRGHGSQRIRQDLVRRGVARDLAVRATTADPAEERARAVDLATRRAARLAPDLPREAALRRLAGYLGRKGFSAEVVWTAAKMGMERARTAGSEDPSIASPASHAEQQGPFG